MKKSIALALFFLGTLTVTAQTNPERDALRGLTSLKVLVERLDSEVEGAGLVPSQIQADTELRLRRNGLKVVSKGDAYLYVTVSAIKDKTEPFFAVDVAVEFCQPVNLERDPSIWHPGATTWRRHVIGIYGQSKLEGRVRSRVADMVDEFINDYLAANPK